MLWKVLFNINSFKFELFNKDKVLIENNIIISDKENIEENEIKKNDYSVFDTTQPSDHFNLHTGLSQDFGDLFIDCKHQDKRIKAYNC